MFRPNDGGGGLPSPQPETVAELRRNAIQIPVTAAWRKFLEDHANSIPSLRGTEIDTSRAQLTLGVETLLGIQSGSKPPNGGGDVTIVAVKEGVVLPVAIQGGVPVTISGETRVGGFPNPDHPVEVQLASVNTAQHVPVTVRELQVPDDEHIQVRLDKGEGTGPGGSQNNPIIVRFNARQDVSLSAVAAGLPDANPVPVKVTNPTGGGTRFRYTHCGRVLYTNGPTGSGACILRLQNTHATLPILSPTLSMWGSSNSLSALQWIGIGDVDRFFQPITPQVSEFYNFYDSGRSPDGNISFEVSSARNVPNIDGIVPITTEDGFNCSVTAQLPDMPPNTSWSLTLGDTVVGNALKLGIVYRRA